MVIFTDGEDTNAVVHGRPLDDILKAATDNKIPLYFVRINYGKGYNEAVPDALWKESVEKAGGRFYIAQRRAQPDGRRSPTSTAGRPARSRFVNTPPRSPGSRASRSPPCRYGPPRPRCGSRSRCFRQCHEEDRVRMTIVLRVVGALLLLGAAAVARNDARLARREADAWQQLATLRYDGTSIGEAAPGPLLASALGERADAERRQATVEYWLGRYADLVDRQGGATDADVLFVAANAAFRTARLDRTVGPEAARQLDGVMQAYASVLKSEPRHPDAAYNFEYVSRLRDRIGQMKPAPPGEGARVARAPPDRSRPPTCRAAHSVHGLPGGPPPEIKAEEFQILTPSDLGDRESDPEQAPGSRMRRKG